MTGFAGRPLAALGFGAPAVLGLGLFLVLPFVMAIVLTFTNEKLLSPNETEFVGLRNYERLISMTVLVQDEAEEGPARFERVRNVTRTDPRYEGFRPLTQMTLGERRYVLLASDPIFVRSLFNTFLFAVMVVPLQCGLALGLALLVTAGLKGQTAFRTIYFSPVVMSMVVVAVVWAFLFNPDVGLLNVAIRSLSFGTLEGPDWLGNQSTAMPAIVIMSAWQGAGLQMLIFVAGLQAIPQELYDAARVDGAGAFGRFRNVTLPGLASTITFVVVVTTIAAFGLFTQVDVMTEGGPQGATSTVMFYAIERGVREQDTAYGATITVLYFLIIAVIAVVQQRFLARREVR